MPPKGTLTSEQKESIKENLDGIEASCGELKKFYENFHATTKSGRAMHDAYLDVIDSLTKDHLNDLQLLTTQIESFNKLVAEMTSGVDCASLNVFVLDKLRRVGRMCLALTLRDGRHRDKLPPEKIGELLDFIGKEAHDLAGSVACIVAAVKAVVERLPGMAAGDDDEISLGSNDEDDAEEEEEVPEEDSEDLEFVVNDGDDGGADNDVETNNRRGSKRRAQNAQQTEHEDGEHDAEETGSHSGEEETEYEGNEPSESTSDADASGPEAASPRKIVKSTFMTADGDFDVVIADEDTDTAATNEDSLLGKRARS